MISPEEVAELVEKERERRADVHRRISERLLSLGFAENEIVEMLGTVM